MKKQIQILRIYRRFIKDLPQTMPMGVMSLYSLDDICAVEDFEELAMDYIIPDGYIFAKDKENSAVDIFHVSGYKCALVDESDINGYRYVIYDSKKSTRSVLVTSTGKEMEPVNMPNREWLCPFIHRRYKAKRYTVLVKDRKTKTFKVYEQQTKSKWTRLIKKIVAEHYYITYIENNMHRDCVLSHYRMIYFSMNDMEVDKLDFKYKSSNLKNKKLYI